MGEPKGPFFIVDGVELCVRMVVERRPDMAQMVDALILSREKSINMLNGRIHDLSLLSASAKSPAARKVYDAQISLASQRKRRLVEELEALRAELAQLALPGTAPVGPPEAGPVKGKAR